MRFPAARGAAVSQRSQAQELQRLQAECADPQGKLNIAHKQGEAHHRRSQRSEAESDGTRAELERARAELERTRTERDGARAQLQEARRRIGKLQLEVATLIRLVFGRKSEKAPDPKTDSGSQADSDSATDPEPTGAPEDTPEKPGKRKGHKKKPPPRKRGRQPGSPTPPRRDRSSLPRLIELLELPEHERCCDHCGKPFLRCGTDPSTIFEIELAAFARRVHRQCYVPACPCARPARRVVAPPAPRLWPGTQLGTSVWSWCVVQVFHHHRTQAAVARDLDAMGLGMASSTLSQGLHRLARLVQPLEDAIGKRLGQAAVVQADETSWPVQYIEGQDDQKEPPASGAKPKHWLWMVCSEDAVWMRVLPTRGLPSGQKLLGKLGADGQLTLVCDRWSAYSAFEKRFPNVRLQLCSPATRLRPPAGSLP